MFNRRLKSFLPSIYDEIKETDNLLEAEEAVLENARGIFLSIFRNSFIVDIDIDGIKIYEKMLGIRSNPETESLEFRKTRILNRFRMSIPFTLRFLKSKFDEIFGVDAWNCSIDYDSYKIQVEAGAKDKNWYQEIYFTINKIKPCNMIFVLTPDINQSIMISEKASWSILQWKYKLGSWRLGEFPFAIETSSDTIKEGREKSIQDMLIEDISDYTATKIESVLINDSEEITDFIVKQSTGNQVTIKYELTPEIVSVVQNIKLLDGQENVLSDISTYFPVTESVTVKHIIKIKEGE